LFDAIFLSQKIPICKKEIVENLHMQEPVTMHKKPTTTTNNKNLAIRKKAAYSSSMMMSIQKKSKPALPCVRLLLLAQAAGTMLWLCCMLSSYAVVVCNKNTEFDITHNQQRLYNIYRTRRQAA